MTLVLFSGAFLLFKYASNNGVSALSIMVYFFGVAFVCFAGHAGMTRTQILSTPLIMGALVLAAVLGYAGNYCQTMAVTTAPNPGYALAIISSQAIVVALASCFLFSSDLSLMKIVGIVLCTSGVVFLSL
jgi:drug/metabolite transporter (DMT)-like permease